MTIEMQPEHRPSTAVEIFTPDLGEQPGIPEAPETDPNSVDLPTPTDTVVIRGVDSSCFHCPIIQHVMSELSEETNPEVATGLVIWAKNVSQNCEAGLQTETVYRIRNFGKATTEISCGSFLGRQSKDLRSREV